MDWEPQLDLDGGYMGAYMCKNSLSCALKICVLYMLHTAMQFFKNMITTWSLSAPFGLVPLATGYEWSGQEASGGVEERVGRQRTKLPQRPPGRKGLSYKACIDIVNKFIYPHSRYNF